MLLRGQDITDVPTGFRAEDDGQLEVVISSRASTLEGHVRDGTNQPVPDATIYVFGADQRAWSMTSPRTVGAKQARLTGSGSPG